MTHMVMLHLRKVSRVLTAIMEEQAALEMEVLQTVALEIPALEKILEMAAFMNFILKGQMKTWTTF